MYQSILHSSCVICLDLSSLAVSENVEMLSKLAPRLLAVTARGKSLSHEYTFLFMKLLINGFWGIDQHLYMEQFNIRSLMLLLCSTFHFEFC